MTDLRARSLPTYRLVAPNGAHGVAPHGVAAVSLRHDDAQRSVIEHAGGPLLVLAGPGTGKTATVVDAVVDRITRRAVDPEHVLVLTFSRRAAGELRERIVDRLGRTTREPLARTFHSYAFGLLRIAAAARGAPPPRLLAGPEQDLLVRELLAGDIDAGGARWPGELRAALGTRGFAAELRDLIMRAVERGIGPADMAGLGRAHNRAEWVGAAEFLQQYADVTALSGSTAYDPAELIRAALDALREEPALVHGERNRLRRIFVDEYQDTDPAQEALLGVLAQGADEVVAVGDPDQSVYGFRGADPAAIRRFPDRFPQPDGSPAPTVALSTSRRAGRTLLTASRRVAARLRGPVAHRDLVPATGIPPGRLRVGVLSTASEEADYVAQVLREEHLRRGVAWSEMAVLVRSTVRTLPQLRRALLAAGVPVTLDGDDLPLAESPAVAPFLMLLRVATAPHGCDGDAALELVRSALGGADALHVRRLLRALRALDLAGGGQGAAVSLLAAALDDPRDLATLDGRLTRPARRIAGLLAAVRAGIGTGDSAEDVLWAAWSGCGLAAVWERASRSGAVPARGPAAGGATIADGQAARAAADSADRNLDAMLALFDEAARYTDRVRGGTLRGFLDHVAGQQIPGDTLAPRAARRDAVRILTAHASKGLQWPVVVVAGVQEGAWPDLRVRGSVLGSERLVDIESGRDVPGVPSLAPLLDEERRLFYVAVTRASRSLVVTAVRDDEQTPSRFLDELDPVPGDARPVTVPPRSLSLPALTAELRRVVTDAGEPSARREAAAGSLARLAAAGVPGADPDQWWGLAELSDTRPVLDPEAPVRVSPSSIDAFGDCELRWLMRQLGADPQGSLAADVGTLIHELASWLALPDVDPELMRGELETSLNRFNLGAPWLADREREKARAMLEKLLAWRAAYSGRDILATEAEIRVAVGGRAVIRGRVDWVEADSVGRARVIDFKTGRGTAADVARNAQLGAYQLAVEGDGIDGVPAGTPSGGAALLGIGGTAKAYKERMQPPLAEDPEDPGWARALVETTAEGMSGAVFRAFPERQLCRACPVRRTCPAHSEGWQVGERDT